MTKHATLGASSSHRWMECPGAPGLAEREGLESTSSSYAREGSAAHEIAARCLDRKVDPDIYVDTLVEIEGETIEVTEEMAEAVAVYVNAVRAALHKAGPTAELFVERTFDLAPLNPPAPMFGTADAVIWRPAVPAQKANINGRPVVISPKAAILEVFDLKYGQGVVVEVTGNSQMRYYALGAVVATEQRPERIRVHVIQPRAPHPDGPHRTEELTWGMLTEFKRELFAAAEATLDPHAPLVAGEHCRFCPASAVCPARQDMAEEVVNAEFGALAVVDQPEAMLPVPAAMDLAQQQRVMELAPVIEDWFSAVREHVKLQTEAGVDTGYKLVPKRATRRWRDEESATNWLENHLGDEAYTRKLQSPYQAERRLKKLGLALPDDAVIAVSGGTNLVPLDDPREAVALPAAPDDEFEPIVPEDVPDGTIPVDGPNPVEGPDPLEGLDFGEMDVPVQKEGSEFADYQPDTGNVAVDEPELEETIDDIIDAVRWRVETPDGDVWEGEAANEADARRVARQSFDTGRLPNHTKATRL